MKGKLVYYFDEPMTEGWHSYYLPEGKEMSMQNIECIAFAAHGKHLTISGRIYKYFDAVYEVTENMQYGIPEGFDPVLWKALFDLGANVEIRELDDK